jgi:GNAT superfamily N-acetyltransferase
MNMNVQLPDFLPGKLVLEPGIPRDYRALEQFHYLPKRPATWAGVWRIRYGQNDDERLVGVGVLSYPTARCSERERFFGHSHDPSGEHVRFANANLRTISRVIVHPQFRSLGLSTVLVKCLIQHCPTRYVEAMARMGRAHPFFERAGMRRVEPEDPKAPVYFIVDRGH